MAVSAWDLVKPDARNAFGFIAVDEHTHKGCVIQEATDLGVRLVMIDASTVPKDFVLYSLTFDQALPCKAIARTDEMIDAWFNCDHFEAKRTPPGEPGMSADPRAPAGLDPADDWRDVACPRSRPCPEPKPRCRSGDPPSGTPPREPPSSSRRSDCRSPARSRTSPRVARGLRF